jgi:hypothetical protein
VAGSNPLYIYIKKSAIDLNKYLQVGIIIISFLKKGMDETKLRLSAILDIATLRKDKIVQVKLQ